MEEADLIPRPGNVRHEWHWVRPVLEELLADNPDCGTIPRMSTTRSSQATHTYGSCLSGSSLPSSRSTCTAGTRCYSSVRVVEEGSGSETCDESPTVREGQPVQVDYLRHRYQPLIDRLCRDMGFRVSTQILTKEVE